MAHFGLALLRQKQIKVLLLTATGIGAAPSLVAFKQLSKQFANKGKIFISHLQNGINWDAEPWLNLEGRQCKRAGIRPRYSPWTTQWKKSPLAASRLPESPGAPRSQWIQQEWRGQPPSSRKSLGVNELRSPAEALCFYHQDALFHPSPHLSVHIFPLTPVILVPFSKFILGFFFSSVPPATLVCLFFPFFPLKSFFPQSVH